VRAAAEDAGIDHSTAYARRKAHGEFASHWRGALALHEQWKRLQEEGAIEALRADAAEERRLFEQRRALAREAEEVAALRANAANPSTIHSSVDGPPPPGKLGEELAGGGAQLKRVGHDRWSQAKEKLFFDELAATANVKRAAAAAGVSTNAVYARRMKQPLFRAKWDAVLQTGRAAIEMKLVEAANKSFDPEEIDTGGVEPKVSVAEAIRIVQMHGSKKQQEWVDSSLEEQAARMSETEVEELRERIMRKLRRLTERRRREQLEEGWTLDETFNHMIPPGWIRAE
jgi:hypothetical protein